MPNISAKPEHPHSPPDQSRSFIRAPKIREVYACGHAGCTTTGDPTVMYNVACNLRETSDEELETLVLCSKCAFAYARRTNRVPGQKQSGVFLLAATLKARMECGIISPMTFYCAGLGCRTSGEPRRLFNLACTDAVDSYGVDALLKRIRCRTCAEKTAKSRGRDVGQPGCGVYPLIHTLSRLGWYVPEKPKERQRLEHIIWDRQRRRPDL